MITDNPNPMQVVDDGSGRAMSEVVPNTFNSNIDEWDYKWEGPVVTWKLDKPNDDQQPYNIQRIITLALMAWGLHTQGIRFQLKRRASADVDIPITFLKKEEDALFRQEPNVLAYAYFPNKTQKIGGDMTFNDEYIWSRDGLGVNAHLVDPEHYTEDTKVLIRTYNLQHTCTHESGHAIGLKHSVNCPECIMHPYYNGQVWPQPNDLERVTGIYGKREFKNTRRYDVLSKRVQEMWKPKDVATMKKLRDQRNKARGTLEARMDKIDARKAEKKNNA